jgi:IMP cyclohydrolase
MREHVNLSKGDNRCYIGFISNEIIMESRIKEKRKKRETTSWMSYDYHQKSEKPEQETQQAAKANESICTR